MAWMHEGGPVLWVIAACGILGMYIFVERSIHLHRARIKFQDFLGGIVNILRRRNIDEALAICHETPGPVAYVTRIAILNRHAGEANLRAAVHDAGAAEISRLERRLVILASVAQLTPLLGLLGTVLGMIEFVIAMQANAPLVQSADVLGGLMRALLSTAAGLMVAIPSYAGFNVLVLKIDRLVLDMEQACGEILTVLSDLLKEGMP